MTPHQGASIYRHVRETRPDLVLELGDRLRRFGRVHLRGSGRERRRQTADGRQSRRRLRAGEGLANPGFAQLGATLSFATTRPITGISKSTSLRGRMRTETVSLSTTSVSSTVRAQLHYRRARSHPRREVAQAGRLASPGRPELVLAYDSSPSGAPEPFPLSQAERREPNVGAVYDLIVRQHPNFTEFVVENKSWGWAHKAPTADRRYDVRRSTPLTVIASSQARRLKQRLLLGIRRSP